MKTSLITQRGTGTPQSASRPTRRRLSASHILIVLAVVLAFALNILALQDRSARVMVAIADQPISAGTALSDEMVRFVPIDAGFEGLDSMLTEDGLAAFSGWVMQRSVLEGAVIEVSTLAEPGVPSGRRTMSLPVSPTRAAGGTIVVGDRVDVIVVRDGEAGFVVADIEVVGLAAAGGSAFSAASDYHLVVAVVAEEALALARAMDSGAIDIVRSSGAPPVETVQPEDPTEAAPE